ncbi:MAG: glycosyltransferase family 39 protein [Planctomycetota bacterium]
MTDSDRRIRPSDLVLLFGFALLLGATGGDAPLQDIDEPRFAGSSRAMLEPDGDWIVPHFNGEERLHKPVLTYWVQALSMRAFGVSEYFVRLPSAAAVALAAVCTAALGQQLGLKRWPALLAGAVMATCVQVQVMAHAATADALLLACTTLTAWAQVRHAMGPRAQHSAVEPGSVRGTAGAMGDDLGRPRAQHSAVEPGSIRGTAGAMGDDLGRPPIACFVVVWAGVAAAFLTKGPAGIVGPAALGVGLWAAGFRPSWRRCLAGGGLALALVAAWGVPALIRSEGRFFSEGVMRHVVSRSLVAFEGHGGYAPWWYAFYLAVVPAMFLPWSPLLGHVFAALAPRARWPVAAAPTLLRWWVAGVVAVFTLVTSKLPHYVLPAYPALAIALLASLQFGLRRSSRLERILLRATGVVLLVALPVALWSVGAPRAGGLALAAGACFAGGCLYAARALADRRGVQAVAVCVVGAAGGFGLLFGRVVREWSPDLVQRRAVDDLESLRSPAVAVAAYRINMPSLVWILDRQVDFLVDEDERSDEQRVCELVTQPGHVVVTDARYVRDLLAWLAQAGFDTDRAERVRARLESPARRCRGFNVGRGRVTELVVLGNLDEAR